MPSFREKLTAALPRLLKEPTALAALDKRMLVKIYREARDWKAEINAEAKTETGPLDSLMERVEAFLLERLKEEGVDGFSTPDGSVNKKTNRYVQVKDWGAFLAWAEANQHMSMLKKDVAKSEILGFMDEFDTTPPGIAVVVELTLEVRKPRA